MTAASDAAPPRESGADPRSRLRLVLDDATADRLRTAAARKGLPLDVLMADLLRAASHRVDEVLGAEIDVDDDGEDGGL